MNSHVIRGKVFQGSAAVLLARVNTLNTGDPITQDDISTIECTVYDDDTAEVITPTYTLTIADVIYDTLQTDARWKGDKTGYNFAPVMAGSNFPAGHNTVQAECVFTPFETPKFKVIFEIQIMKTHGA